MFFKTLVLGFAFSAGFAFANPLEAGVNGEWAGKGTYIFDGEMSQCSTMEMRFFANESTFVFVGGQRICDNHEEQFYQVALNYADGKLTFNGQEVGTYSDNEINVWFSQPESNGDMRHWRMSIRVEGDHLMYEESRRMNEESTPLISFAGMLQRQ